MALKTKKISLKFKIGSFLTLLLLLMSFASFFFDGSQTMNLEKSYEAPSFNHPFGLDENGQDIFIKTLHGSRFSLTTALSVAFLSLVIGLLLGTLSGYFNSIDPFLMRIVDAVYAFPNFLLAVSLMAFLGASLFNLILVMCLSTWAVYARIVRGEVLHLKQTEFVVSAHSLGAGFFHKTIRHIWPNLIPVLAVQTTLTLAGVILSESGLSFLGIGAPPETPTWGALLRSGRQALIEAPHLSLFPGLCLFLFILGFHLLGEGLRDFFSPHKS